MKESHDSAGSTDSREGKRYITQAYIRGRKRDPEKKIGPHKLSDECYTLVGAICKE